MGCDMKMSCNNQCILTLIGNVHLQFTIFTRYANTIGLLFMFYVNKKEVNDVDTESDLKVIKEFQVMHESKK